MTIRVLDDTAAVARLAAIRFKCSIKDAAARLAEWESTQDTLLVPLAIELRPVQRDGAGSRQYVDRVREARAQIAESLGVDAKAAERLTFEIQGKHAWYLGPRPNLDPAKTALAVQQTPEKYIQLMLQRELIEDAAFDAEDVFVSGGFGSGVYLGSLGQRSRKRLQLVEAKFIVRPKYNQLLCDVVAQTFAKKTVAAEGSAVARPIDTGHGYMVDVTRLVPKDYIKLDGRERPLVGISLDRGRLRESRLYYLNVLHEFALKLFMRAGVPVEAETFQATHCVDEAFIPLDALANLRRPLHVINASGEELTADAIRPLERFQDYFPDGYHVAGNKKTQFQPISVTVEPEIPAELLREVNYLFLNGEGDGDFGSVRVGRGGESPGKGVRAIDAYAALARGDGVADPYTEAKYRSLLDCETVSVVTQGLDYGPAQLAAVQPGGGGALDVTLREALKRCLVELSIKEGLIGSKSLPMPGLPEALAPSSLTLIATRSILGAGKQPKQLVAAVDVEIHAAGVSVSRVRRSPWSSDVSAAVRFLGEFSFLLQDRAGRIQDRQFWVVDRVSGQRLVIWSGRFVPQLLLNDEYLGIEAALAAQDQHLGLDDGRGGKRKYFSKDRQFNLLPYYMSLYRRGHAPRGERLGTRIPVQDCGGFVRVFVPPEGGINGPGDSLSRFRDVMLYGESGELVDKHLLDQRLVHLYLHTMTNGVLVGGDNSKMSILEKLARLALEN